MSSGSLDHLVHSDKRKQGRGLTNALFGFNEAILGYPAMLEKGFFKNIQNTFQRFFGRCLCGIRRSVLFVGEVFYEGFPFAANA